MSLDGRTDGLTGSRTDGWTITQSDRDTRTNLEKDIELENEHVGNNAMRLLSLVSKAKNAEFAYSFDLHVQIIISS